MTEPKEDLIIRGFVSGRVQGVGFRYFVRKNALALGLSGSATNLFDGRVEVIAAGQADALELLKQAVQKGPALSSVQSVAWELIQAEVPKGFVIG